MEEQGEQQPHHASSQAYSDACSEDEVSLFDLWRILVRQWKVLGAITGLSVLGAVAYIFLAAPVYKAQAIVKPPESKYVAVLNIPGISEVSSADIFAKFTGNLKSRSLCQQFVDENPQFASLREKVPEIKEESKNEGGHVSVSIQGYDSKLVADWVNGFIQLAERRTLGDVFDDIEIKIANQKKPIQIQLQIGKNFAAQRRLDRIALLENQIAIARASKIFDRQLSGYSVEEGQRFGETVDILQRPLYMRGVKELVAEKEELEKRKNDEPFIAGFRDKQESLALLDVGLKQLQTARAIARAATVDQLAIQAKNPVEPVRMRVLAWGILLGGMIGVFAAFVVNSVQQQKVKPNEWGPDSND